MDLLELQDATTNINNPLAIAFFKNLFITFEYLSLIIKQTKEK